MKAAKQRQFQEAEDSKDDELSIREQALRIMLEQARAQGEPDSLDEDDDNSGNITMVMYFHHVMSFKVIRFLNSGPT